MKFWRRYWYLIGGVLFVFLTFFMGQLWIGIPSAFMAMIICFIAPVFIRKNKALWHPNVPQNRRRYRNPDITLDDMLQSEFHIE